MVGAPPIVAVFEEGRRTGSILPVNLAAGDFDGDGATDLVIGWSSVDGVGYATLLRGDLSSIVPWRPGRARVAASRHAAPFLPEMAVQEVPVIPAFLAAGDFNGDGRCDLALAHPDDGAIWILESQGRTLGAAKKRAMPGFVRALGSGEVNRPDGLMDIVASVEIDGSGSLLVLESPGGALDGEPEIIPTDSVATTLVIRDVDHDGYGDIATSALNSVSVAWGRDRLLTLSPEVRTRAARSQVEQTWFSREVTSLAVGNFVNDADLELAAVLANGAIEVMEGRRGFSEVPASLSYGPTSGLSQAPLSEDDRSVTGVKAARVAPKSHDELVHWGPDGALRATSLDRADASRMEATYSLPAPSLVLPMRLNQDAFDDLVIVSAATGDLQVILTQEDAVFVVNAPGNDNDYSQGDGICDADNSPEVQECTLRAAIQEGNAGDGESYRIEFSIDDLGDLTNLPTMTKPVTFDGGNVLLDGSAASSAPRLNFQAGYSVLQGVRAIGFGNFTLGGANNRVEANWFGTVDGVSDGGARGGVVLEDATDSTIGGPTIALGNVFVGPEFVEAIQLWGEDNRDNTIQGNYIGTDATGSGGLGSYGGIRIRNAVNTTVGGAGAKANIISRIRGGSGIHASQSDGLLIQGNLIGTDSAGQEGYECSSYGIWVEQGSTSITIGGTSSGLGNVVASARRHGIVVSDGSGVLIQGNKIGTNLEGNKALGNGRQGIWLLREGTSDAAHPSAVGGSVDGAGNVISGNATAGAGIGLYKYVEVIGNKIGTDGTGESALPNQSIGLALGTTTRAVVRDNIIAFNGGDGIELDWDGLDVETGFGNRISQNSIFSNGGLGINLYASSEDDISIVTPNDAGDGDTGPNLLQNYPVLSITPGSSSITGSLDSRPSRTYTLEFFASDSCDPSGYGEGKEYLGSVSVSLNASGNGSFSFSGAPAGKVITATATDPDGNTSEFSACAAVPESRPFVVNSTGDEPDQNAVSETYDGICSTGKKADGTGSSCNPQVEGDCECTLRAAIQEANATPVRDEIHFAIDGTNEPSIALQTSLPPITAPVEIDGTTQPGYQGRPPVELAGSGHGVGLHLVAGNSVVRGLVVNRLGTGILVESDGNVIRGNFIGTCHGGSANLCQSGPGAFVAAANGIGIYVRSGQNNLIGGKRPSPTICEDPCNIVSSSSSYGILVTEGNRVQGNFIGLDRMGDYRFSNLIGISVSLAAGGSPTLIGGVETGAGNVISANLQNGIQTAVHWGKVIVEGNLIGTDSSGVKNRGNGKAGIFYQGVAQSPEFWIGGLEAESGNRIAFNKQGVEATTPVILLSNEIFSNETNISFRDFKSPIEIEFHHLGVTTQQGASAQEQQISAAWHASTLSEFPTGVPAIVQLFRSGSEMPCEEVELLASFNVLRSDDSEKVSIHRRSVVEGVSLLSGDFLTATVTVPDALIGTSLVTSCTEALIDSDGDGVYDGLEEEDRNNDGILDSEQPYVSVLQAGGKDWTVETTAGALGAALVFGALERENTMHANGLLDLVLSQLDASAQQQTQGGEVRMQGSAVTVTLTPEPDPALLPVWINYGPTPNDPETHSYDFAYDGQTGAEFFFQGSLVSKIVLHFVDGEKGDHDLQENGVIVTRGGVLSSAIPILYPLQLTSPTLFSGVGTSNFSQRSASMALSLRSASGSLVPGFSNPAFASVDAGQQDARLASEIFRFTPEEETAGWIRILSDNPDLSGLLLIGGGQQLDGAIPFDWVHEELYFTRLIEGPAAFRGRQASTLLSLVHPGRVDTSQPTTPEESRVRLDLLREGQVIATAEHVLEPTTALQGRVQDLLDQEIAVDDSTDVLRATVLEGPGLIGAELVRVEGGKTIVVVNADLRDTAMELYSPQVADLPGVLFTSIKLVNISSNTRQLALDVIGDSGAPIATTLSLSLDPGEARVVDAGEFEYSGTNRVGSLRVETSFPGIIGDVLFGEPTAANWAAALPLESVRFREAVFSQVANIPGVLFTGLAFVNPNDSPASIQIDVYSATGEVTGTKSLVLDGGERISQLVSELIPSTDGQVTGSIRVTSTRRIYAQQLFGDFGGTYLSAVPPRVIE